MSDFRKRLFEESDQLHGRVIRLAEFITTERFDALPDVERADLKEQLKHMRAYSQVLERRCGRQCGNA